MTTMPSSKSATVTCAPPPAPPCSPPATNSTARAGHQPLDRSFIAAPACESECSEFCLDNCYNLFVRWAAAHPLHIVKAVRGPIAVQRVPRKPRSLHQARMGTSCIVLSFSRRH